MSSMPHRPPKRGSSLLSMASTLSVHVHPPDDEDDGTLSLGQGIANHLIMVVGLASILAVPYSIAQGGWILGVASWVIAGVVMSYTAKLLLNSFYMAKQDSGTTPATIPELVHEAFDNKIITAWVTTTFLLELFGNNISSFIVVSDTLQLAFPLVDKRWWHLLLGIGGWLLNATLSLHHLSWTSAVGSFACLAASLLILYNGITNPIAPGSFWQPAMTDLWPQSKQQWIRATLLPGISIGAVAAHSGLSPIFWGLKNRRKTFPTMLNVTFSLGILTYLCSGISGYIMFGRNVDPVVWKSLDVIDKNRRLNDFMSWFVLVVPFSQYPLFLEPVAQALEAPWSRRGEEEVALLGGEARVNPWIGQSLRLFVSLTCMATALLSSNLATILSLVGAVAATTDCIIVPCMVYLRYDEKGKSRWIAWCVMMLGITMSLIGTIGTFISMGQPE